MGWRSPVIPLSPVLLVASATALTGLHHVKRWGQGGILFVHHVGFRSQYDRGVRCSGWPIPLGESCGELAQFAAARGVLRAEAPEMGDIFLVWCKRGRRYKRTGIVAFVEEGERRFPISRLSYYECQTIEALTSEDGTADEVDVVRLLDSLIALTVTLA